jgi:hypothetical protein
MELSLKSCPPWWSKNIDYLTTMSVLQRRMVDMPLLMMTAALVENPSMLVMQDVLWMVGIV